MADYLLKNGTVIFDKPAGTIQDVDPIPTQEEIDAAFKFFTVHAPEMTEEEKRKRVLKISLFLHDPTEGDLQ